MSATGTSQFIEQFAVILESDGLPRVAGRLFGLLLVSPEPLSLDELAERLGVTKASISVNARMLEQKGIVERIGLHGDRRDYYRMTEDIVERAMQQRVLKITQFQSALHTALAATKLRRGVVTERLALMEEGFSFLLENTNRTLDEWRDRTHSRAPRARRAANSRQR